MSGVQARAMASASPGASSPESVDIDVDVEDDPTATQAMHWTSPGSPSQPSRTAAPLPKRRRVTRACDECRRKKIKCDGKQPCTHCTVYSYDCTYDQPSNRRRNPTPQYVESLENRLQRAEALLRTVLPNVDLHDPNIEAVIQQRQQAANAKGRSQTNTSASGDAKSSQNHEISEEDAQLRSMIASTGQLELDEQGHWDFHGGSSGTVFVRRMREQFGGLLGGGHGTPFLPRLPRSATMAPTFESPRSSVESPLEANMPNTIDLPSRAVAQVLCNDALGRACALLRFVHQPTFYAMFNRIYDIPPEQFGDEENVFLPLLYCVLALGCLFHAEPDDGSKEETTYKAGIDQGLKYFKASRQLIDITDCRDITSLQAVLFMILFLQSSANLSTCYSYIGIALRSALRMGLHRNLTGTFNPIEREIRRRVFWIIRKMDIYVAAMLGFPQMLSNDDIDQELPMEVDDEYITKDGILPMPLGKSSLIAASNAHTRLMGILAKLIKYIYPIKGLEQSVQGTSNSSYVVSHAKIREIERDLADWLDKLPMALRPGGDGSLDIVRVQQLLRLAYGHVQMMLYRPFLHYVSQKSCNCKNFDDRAYASAAAGVSVSRNIVHITTELEKRGLLMGAYWFTMYTTFFAILSLVFFVLENPDKPGSYEILADANDGKRALKFLAKRSMAADRCSVALEGLFEQLPQRLKNASPTPVIAKKKRSAPSSLTAATRGDRNSPGHSRSEPPLIPALAERATTFPLATTLQTGSVTRNSLSLDDAQFQTNAMSNSNPTLNFHDLVSSADLSTVCTPDSSSPVTSQDQPQFSLLHQFEVGNALPDLSAMMFPSADPFAYPNQPMMEFDNVKQENFGNMLDGSQASSVFLSNTGASGIYDNLEGQIFGPIPPYLMQVQPIFDQQGQVDAGNGMMPDLNFQDLTYPSGLTPNAEMNFDSIFGGGDEWSAIMADQRYKQ